MQFQHKRSPSPQKKRPSAQVARPVPQPGPIPMPSVAGNPGLRSALGILGERNWWSWEQLWKKKEHFSETKKNLRKSEMNPSEYWDCSVKLSQKMDEICGLEMASPILYSTRQNWSLTSKNEASSTSRISIPVLKHPPFKFIGSIDSLFHLGGGFPQLAMFDYRSL